jgi:hypothetical protein
MAVFPSIVPTVRSGGMGEFATKRFQQISGNVTTRIYARFANNIPLVLEFGGEAGIPDEDVADIYQAWLDSSADRIPITLSDPLFSGMDPMLRSQIPPGMSFYFSSEEPSIVDTVPGRKLMRLRVEGRFSARHVA